MRWQLTLSYHTFEGTKCLGDAATLRGLIYSWQPSAVVVCNLPGIIKRRDTLKREVEINRNSQDVVIDRWIWPWLTKLSVSRLRQTEVTTPLEGFPLSKGFVNWRPYCIKERLEYPWYICSENVVCLAHLGHRTKALTLVDGVEFRPVKVRRKRASEGSLLSTWAGTWLSLGRFIKPGVWFASAFPSYIYSYLCKHACLFIRALSLTLEWRALAASCNNVDVGDPQQPDNKRLAERRYMGWTKRHIDEQAGFQAILSVERYLFGNSVTKIHEQQEQQEDYQILRYTH